MIPPNEIFKKKILIYGLGKSGQASLSYLKHKNLCYVFDDNKKKINKKIKKFYISEINLIKKQFDYIILSPGIDKKNCLLSSYLKKYKKKIITELDVFYKFNPEILNEYSQNFSIENFISKFDFSINKAWEFFKRKL